MTTAPQPTTTASQATTAGAGPASDEELFRRFPGAGIDHDNKEHYRALLDGRLVVNRCADCGHRHHPPLPMCPRCRSTEVSADQVSGRGTIYLLTLMHQGPPAADVDYGTPYPVASVALDEQPGLRYTAGVRVRPGVRPAIGDRVHLEWVERDGHPLPRFVLDADRPPGGPGDRPDGTDGSGR